MKTYAMAGRPPRKLFSVRLPHDILEAIQQRAIDDRRSIVVTTELVILAGLAAMKQQEPRKGKRTS